MDAKRWSVCDRYNNDKGKSGQPIPNNYVVTAYQKVIG